MSVPNPRSGNVLFLILIAVALFAALSYVVTQSSRSGTAGVSDDKLALMATQLLQHGVATRTTIARMAVNGSNMDTLDFWWDQNPVGAVFGKEGGGVRLAPPNLAGVATGITDYFYHTQTADPTSIANIGTTAPDIIMALILPLNASAEKLCGIINKKLGINGVPGSASGPNWNDAAPGQAVACVRNWNTFYIFYYVLYEN